jgi:Na+/melibiose symporter-like transporter
MVAGAGWQVLRRRRDLRLLLVAGLISATGDGLLMIGLSYAVYASTGSTVASAGAVLVSLLPQAAVGPVAGVLVDRWDRRRTMIGANLLLMLVLVPLLAVHGERGLPLVYGVLFVSAVVETFVWPAEQALLPRLVDDASDAELVAANGLNAQAQEVARLVGPALGGLVTAAGGVPAVAIVDAATFLVAAILLLRIKTPSRPARPEPSAEAAVQGRLAALRSEWRDGLEVVRRSSVLRTLVLFALITATGEGIMATLFTPYVRSVLDSDARALGVIVSAQAVGGLIGGALVTTVAGRWRPGRMLAVGSVLFGLVDLAIFVYPVGYVAAWPAVVGMAVVGLPGAVIVAGLMTLFQQHTTDERRGRVFALLLLIRTIATAVGTILAGALAEAVGIIPVLAFQGVGYIVAGAIVRARLRPDP